MPTLRVLCCMILLMWHSALSAQELPAGKSKICGMSLENPPREIDQASMAGVHASGSRWVAVIPYGYSREGDPLVYFDSEFQWWGERVDGTEKLIELAKAEGFKIMLKPQVWMMNNWIGEFDPGSEALWLKWEESYRIYIHTFAKIAEEYDVEIFCIGTEYRRATAARNGYWKNLISEVRKIYSGQLTYAANWDEYRDVGFWSDLDYIGIDAYFPLLQHDDPLIAELTAAWKPVKEQLRNISDNYGKPVLLTEYGYRSVNGAAGNQWEQDNSPINPNAQRKAYLALYEALWHEPWVAGGFAWKWHLKPGAGGPDNSQYTPQGKPALDVIKAVYRKTGE